MKILISIFILFVPKVWADAPFPIFLKYGFSSVLEFREAPENVVIGDSKAFLLEKLGKSIVIKPLVSEAVTNLLVYFPRSEPKTFLLTASEEVTPTLFEKIPFPLEVKTKAKAIERLKRNSRIVRTQYSKKKEFLTIEIELVSRSRPITPDWRKVALATTNKVLKPIKIWAEREEIQLNSMGKARFIFQKPNLNLNKKAFLNIPEKNRKNISLKLSVRGVK